MPDRHALVIEDQELLRDLLSRSLEGLGYSVEAVRALPAADAALRVSAPDVLVVDGRIRGIDVPTWLGVVRPLLPGVPFVVLTGLGANLNELPPALGPCTSILLPLDGPTIAAAVHRFVQSTETVGGASRTYGFDLDVPESTEMLGAILARVEDLIRLGGGLPIRRRRVFLYVLRVALRLASGRGAVRVRCAFSPSQISCEVGMASGAGSWSLEDPLLQLVRSSLTGLDLSPNGERLSFSLARGVAEAA